MVTTPIRPDLVAPLAKTAAAARDARDTITQARQEARDSGLAEACPDLLAALDRAANDLDTAQGAAFAARG